MANSLPVVAAFLVVIGAPGAFGYASYRDKIPNGNNVMVDGTVWEGVGHLRRSGGGARNPFGIDFAAAGKTWTQDLCKKDSDGDGLSNGQELGDPECKWTEGSVPQFDAGITHPGICDGEIAAANSIDSCDKYVEPSNNETIKFRVKKHTVSTSHTTYVKYTFEWTQMGMNAPSAPYYAVKVTPFVQNSNVVHHMLLYGCQSPQEEAGAQAYLNTPSSTGGMPCTAVKHSWAVGGSPFCYPPTVGALYSTATKYFVLEIHYDNPQGLSGIEDESGLDMTMIKQADAPGHQAAGFLLLGAKLTQLSVPPGKKVFEVRSELDPKASHDLKLNMFAFFVHGHGIAKKIWTEVHRNGEYAFDAGCNTEFDFDLQEILPTAEPVTLYGDDKFIVRCIYDSSERTTVTVGGDETENEMCIAMILYYPALSISNALTTPTFPSNPTGEHTCSIPGQSGAESKCTKASGTGQAAPDWMQTHAYLMLFAWCFALPCGAFMSLLYRSAFKELGDWFKYHRVIQVIGLLVAIVAFAMACDNVSQGHFNSDYNGHKIIGLAVMILAVLQPMNAFLRPHAPGDGEAKTLGRTAWEVLHKGSGWIAIILGMVNCVLGALAYKEFNGEAETESVWIAFGALTGVTVLAFAAGFRYRCASKGKISA